jgi:hypothetical protein
MLDILATCTANFNLQTCTCMFEIYWILNNLLKQHFIWSSLINGLNSDVLQTLLKNKNCNCKNK